MLKIFYKIFDYFIAVGFHKPEYQTNCGGSSAATLQVSTRGKPFASIFASLSMNSGLFMLCLLFIYSIYLYCYNEMREPEGASVFDLVCFGVCGVMILHFNNIMGDLSQK